jgi:spermidine synthase
MILDGRIQLAESDEWVYHELLVHPACAIHGDPRRVIVLGGGDGCAARELLKYSSLTDITVVDIDEQVVELFRGRFSFLNRGALCDPRVRVVCADAMEHLRTSTERYDLIISDLTEPFDPAQAGGNLSRHLYSHESFCLFLERLTPAGILVCQTGGLLLQPAHDRFHLEILPIIRSYFPHVGVGYEFVPSFGEFWTITLGSSRPLRVTPAQVNRSLRRLGVGRLRYYDGPTHRRAFCPPRFAREHRR